MIWREEFTDEDGEPITIQFKDCTGLKLLINKLKNKLITD